MRKLNILIWHIHGSYLAALTQTEHNWFVPIKPDRSEGYVGRGVDSTMPEYVREVPAEAVRDLPLDLVIFQTPKNWGDDQFEILSEAQRRLPYLYLEHNAPEPHPALSRHPVDDPDGLVVHVTPFNRLMWDCGQTPTTVVEHSVAIDPHLRYRGHRPQGITVLNEFQRRGRMVGFDLFEQARRVVPLTTVGMKSADLGGLGEIHYRYLHATVAEYRFLFSPMRYTSLPLAVVEALTMGMPVVALATTELPTVIQDGVQGFLSNDPDVLIERMKFLLDNPEAARRLGDNARQLALDRFGKDRFIGDWNRVFERAMDRGLRSPTA
jgi:hypothetical protein